MSWEKVVCLEKKVKLLEEIWTKPTSWSASICSRYWTRYWKTLGVVLPMSTTYTLFEIWKRPLMVNNTTKKFSKKVNKHAWKSIRRNNKIHFIRKVSTTDVWDTSSLHDKLTSIQSLTTIEWKMPYKNNQIKKWKAFCLKFLTMSWKLQWSCFEQETIIQYVY